MGKGAPERGRGRARGAEWVGAALGMVLFTGASAATAFQGLTVVGLGAGFVVGLLLRTAPRRWAAVLAFYAALILGQSVVVGRPFPMAVTTTVALIAELLALGWLGRLAGPRGLRAPTDVARLVLVAVVAGIMSLALAFVSTRFVTGIGSDVDTMVQSLLTVAVGVLVASPLVLQYPRSVKRREIVHRAPEVLVLVVVTGALMVAVTPLTPGPLVSVAALFLLFVALGWVAVRFGPWLTSAFLAFVSVWIGWSVAEGHGLPVAPGATLTQQILQAQVYLIVTATAALLLSVYAARTRDQDAAAVESAELLNSAVEGAAAYLFVKRFDPDTGRFVYAEVNRSFAHAMGLETEELIGRSDEDLVDQTAAAEFRAQDEQVMSTGERLQRDGTVHVDGRTQHYYTLKFPVRSADGTVVGVGGVSLDRTEERRREDLLQTVFARSPVATARLRWTGTAIGEVLEVNDSFAALLGASKQDLVGRGLDRVLLPGDRLVQSAGAAGFALPNQRREMRLRRLDGAELTVLATTTVVSPGDPADAFVLAILEDVTAARAAEAGLVHRATHDALTDLFNRQALVERLSADLARPDVRHAGLTVLCCDIDSFKQVNDSLGHEAGDRVLLEVAGRLRDLLRPEDLVGRLGADEFVVVCPGVGREEDAVAVAERVREAIAVPIDIDGRTHGLRCSVGVAVDRGSAGAEDLLRQADVALTRAKDLGRDRVEVYRADHDRRVQMRLAMRETVRLALSENRVDVHAQPVVDPRTGSIVGAEALVRLRDLDGSLLPPAAFIPVAEESGLIVPLGLRVLDLSLAMQARWAAAGSTIDMAVNVSPRQLAEATFPVSVTTLLEAHGVPPASLTLEVTETAVVDATGSTRQVLSRLRDLGVHVAIDDFGTGYSSLTSLRDLPADIVKIDRSFVSGVTRDTGDQAIVRAVLAMAHATGRVVVAEGVETSAQAARLTELGCDRLQGYWYSRPVPAAEFDPARTFGAIRPEGPGSRSRTPALRSDD